MPEYPDLINYKEALEERILGERLGSIQLLHPFLLRSVSPPPTALEGRKARSVALVGKRILISLDNGTHLLLHLMIAGRLHWAPAGKGAGRTTKPLGRFHFSSGTLILTEAGSKRRAALHLCDSFEAVATFDRGGVDPFTVSAAAFAERISSENHTLKRSLTDPRMVSGVGNAYSDEILFAAGLSPFDRTGTLGPGRSEALHRAMREVLTTWAERIRVERAGGFPKGVTAFRKEMAVHGKFGSPCRECGTEIQRIRYAENECNYCPRCQTGGKVFSDRALSRLLKDDWPSRIEELEELRSDR